VSEYEALLRIVEADDKAAEAWAECKALTRKLEELNRLYDAKCTELATMTKEARRWMRKAQASEKGATA
jgi:ferric-dicitrate binding protein FerR (iron transport regulator)